MLTTIVKRLLQGLIVIVCVTVLIFVLLRKIPGDPARQLATISTQEAVEKLREEMGLNKTIPEQLILYIRNLFRGSLGYSYFQKAPVDSVISQSAGGTGLMLLLALVFSTIIGLFLGILAAVRKNTVVDRIISLFSVVFQSVPNYWLAIILIQLVCVQWKLLPSVGYKGFSYVILPSFILALPLIGVITKNVRTNMVASLDMDFVKAAKARGIPSFVALMGYALRNSLIPIITLIGLQLGYLVGNCLVIEYIFSFPGIGLHTLNAILRRDYFLVQALVMLLTFLFVIVNTIVDISYLYLDPRIRKAQGGL